MVAPGGRIDHLRLMGTDPLLDSCSLTPSQQRRNLLVFAGCTGLQYFAAPVLYVGITQAALCDRLGATTAIANLPTTMYFAMTITPALLAWWLPYVSWLKRNLVLCYALNAAMMALLAVTLASPLANPLKIALVVLQGAVCGATMPLAIALLWEMIGRGLDASARGLALSLAFGVGPLLAVIGSMGQAWILGGGFFWWKFDGFGYPTGFVMLFGIGAPAIALAAMLSSACVVALPKQEAVREPFHQVQSLFMATGAAMVAVLILYLAGSPGLVPSPRLASQLGWAGYAGLLIAVAAIAHHYRDVFSNRVLLVATIVTVLVYTGNTIPGNMNLYTKELLGEAAEQYAGVQNAMRFGFKTVTGLLLGWLLTKTSPRAGVLVTATIFVAAQIWAIFATGEWYLVAFGIYGAGELVGVYAPNYILTASTPDQMRRNMAMSTMLMAPAGPTAYVFGGIVDRLAPKYGLAAAFRASFWACGALIAAGILLAIIALPRDGRAPETRPK